jgi:hypothetical protein
MNIFSDIKKDDEDGEGSDGSDSDGATGEFKLKTKKQRRKEKARKNLERKKQAAKQEEASYNSLALRVEYKAFLHTCISMFIYRVTEYIQIDFKICIM